MILEKSSTCLCPKYIKCIWETAGKIKTDVDRQLLISKIKKSSILTKCIEKICF